MRTIMIAALAGLLFGLGLTISGMINPAKVLGFLDIAGDWDPSLVLVLCGAIGVAAAGFAWGRRQFHPFAAAKFQTPAKRSIDMPLVAGALLFGTGWGLIGYCPGPMLAALALGRASAVQAVAAMLAGMALFELWRKRG